MRPAEQVSRRAACESEVERPRCPARQARRRRVLCWRYGPLAGPPAPRAAAAAYGRKRRLRPETHRNEHPLAHANADPERTAAPGKRGPGRSLQRTSIDRVEAPMGG